MPLRFPLLPAIAVAFATGILAADRGGWVSGSALQLGLAFFAIGLVWRPARYVLSIGVAFAAGALSLAVSIEASRSVSLDATFDAVIEGRVCGATAGSGWIARDLCGARNRRVPGFDGRDVPPRIRIRAFREREGFEALSDLSTGTRVRARLRVRPLRSVRNPGGRRWAAPLVRRGVGAEASVVAPPLVVAVQPGSSTSQWRGIVRNFRRRLGDRLHAEGPGGALIAALTLGDRRGLGAGERDAFRALGASHLLAISGLHVVAVAGLAYVIGFGGVRRVPSLAARFDTRRMAAFGALTGATLYAGLAGWGIPVQRAWILLAAVVLGALLGRRAAARERLAAAALVVLSLDPAALFDLGAQLSFAATAALLLDPGPLRRSPLVSAAGAPDRWLRQAFDLSLRASATALAATVPILAFHGMPVTPVALLANLVLVPVFAFVVLPGSLLGLAFAYMGGLGPALGTLCGVFHELVCLLEFFGAAVSSLQVAAVVRPPVLWLCVGMAVATLCVRGTAKRFVGSLACVGVLALPSNAPLAPPAPYLAVLDVGRGDAILVKGRRAAVLVDAGGAFPGGTDRGRSVVLPALRRLGVHRLDVVVASHADLDHRGGLPAVLRALSVGEVWVPPGGTSGPSFSELRQAARERSVPVIERGAGDTALSRGDLVLDTLWPPRASSARSRNERSLVIRVDVGDVGVLLPGDVGVSSESKLIEAGKRVSADVLVLPHHGSAGSSSLRFLEAISPDVAVVSAPCDETSRLPAEAALERVHSVGAALWWTGRDGAVVVSLGDPVVAWGWRQFSFSRRCRWRGAS